MGLQARCHGMFGTVIGCGDVRFRLRMDSAESLFRRIGRRLGVKLVPLMLNDGRQSIDVDNARTLRVTEELIAREAA